MPQQHSSRHEINTLRLLDKYSFLLIPGKSQCGTVWNMPHR